MSIWSKKPTPVRISLDPVPSRFTSSDIDVSVVLRSIFDVRIFCFVVSVAKKINLTFS